MVLFVAHLLFYSNHPCAAESSKNNIDSNGPKNDSTEKTGRNFFDQRALRIFRGSGKGTNRFWKVGMDMLYNSSLPIAGDKRRLMEPFSPPHRLAAPGIEGIRYSQGSHEDLR